MNNLKIESLLSEVEFFEKTSQFVPIDISDLRRTEFKNVLRLAKFLNLDVDENTSKYEVYFKLTKYFSEQMRLENLKRLRELNKSNTKE